MKKIKRLMPAHRDTVASYRGSAGRGCPDVTVMELTGKGGITLAFYAEDGSGNVYVTMYGPRAGVLGTTVVGRAVAGQLARLILDQGVHLEPGKASDE